MTGTQNDNEFLSGVQKAARELTEAISGQMDANLFESIVSLFNSGVLVHYVKNPKTTVNPDNFRMTVNGANGVRFEGRQKIIQMERELTEAQELCRELVHVMEVERGAIYANGSIPYKLNEALTKAREKMKSWEGK